MLSLHSHTDISFNRSSLTKVMFHITNVAKYPWQKHQFSIAQQKTEVGKTIAAQLDLTCLLFLQQKTKVCFFQGLEWNDLRH